MSVTYIDEQQKESVKKLLNYILKNFQEELSRGDFKAVYYKIFGNYPIGNYLMNESGYIHPNEKGGNFIGDYIASEIFGN